MLDEPETADAANDDEVAAAAEPAGDGFAVASEPGETLPTADDPEVVLPTYSGLASYWMIAVMAAVALGAIALEATQDPSPPPKKVAAEPVPPLLSAAPTATEPIPMRAIDASRFSLEIAPSGDRVLFAAPGVIEVVPLGGAAVSVPVPAGSDLATAAWHPDGSTLMLGGKRGATAERDCVYELPRGSAPIERVCDTQRAALSPDGRQLAFVREGTLFIADRSGRNPDLAHPAPVAPGPLRWLSDGSAVVVAVADADGELELRAVSTHGRTTLVEGLAPSARGGAEFATTAARGLVWADGLVLRGARVGDGFALANARQVGRAEGDGITHVSIDAEGRRLAYCEHRAPPGRPCAPMLVRVPN